MIQASLFSAGSGDSFALFCVFVLGDPVYSVPCGVSFRHRFCFCCAWLCNAMCSLRQSRLVGAGVRSSAFFVHDV